jgi:hypothetical protein
MATKEMIGKMLLYHATSNEAANSIRSSGEMKPGAKGMFGSAMYFADNVASAFHKAQYAKEDNSTIIMAIVDMGMALLQMAPDPKMSGARARELGCDSVKGRSNPAGAFEYVVYDQSRVQIVRPDMIARFPISDIKILQDPTKKGALSKLPPGWGFVDFDMNETSGAVPHIYCFLAYRTTAHRSVAIEALCLDNRGSGSEGSFVGDHQGASGVGFTRIPESLNRGTTGSDVFVCFARGLGLKPIMMIHAELAAYEAASKEPVALANGWEYVCWLGSNHPANTNYRAPGSRNVFLRFRRAK